CFGIRVGQLERVAVREALLDARLKRVVPGVADRLLHGHSAKLRIGAQQTAARCGRAVNRIGPVEGIREYLAEEIDGFLVPGERLAEILSGCIVDLVVDSKVRSAIADIRGLSEEFARQRVLRAE